MMPSRVAHGKSLLILCALFCAMRIAAQNESSSAVQPFTLHVQTNLVQIPVLVLTPTREAYAETIAPKHFSIRFDEGPWTAPKFARPEGDDPIDLAIVFDARGPQSTLLRKMAVLLEDLTQTSLRPHDHLSLYTISCGSLHASENIPASPQQVRLAADIEIRDIIARDSHPSPACKTDVRLWDTLAYITQILSAQPGRRVILALTNGEDHKSVNTPNNLKKRAQRDGVTIFGFDVEHHVSKNPMFWTAGENTVAEIAEATGGLSLNLEAGNPARLLEHFVQMLRARYILEFPRPSSRSATQLAVSVRLDDRDAFIRTAGNAVPIPDPRRETESPQPTLTASATGIPDIQNSARNPPVTPPPSEPTQPTGPINAITSQETVPAPVADIPTATLRVSTRLTVEDVTVTDAHRRPVHGLLQSNFTLREDGKPQTIRHFAEYISGSTSVKTDTEKPEGGDAISESAGAVDVILLDSLSTGLSNGLMISPETFAYARQQSIKYLRGLPVATRVAILQLGSQVQVLRNVTSDKAALLAAMNATSNIAVPGAYVVQRSQGAACEAANTQSRYTIANLEQLAAILSMMPVRKNVIWFTPGIPWLTQYATFSAISCLRDYTTELRRVYNKLVAAHITLYPIDPRGLSTNPSLSAAASSLMTNPASPSPQMQPPAPALQALAAFGSNVNADHDSLTALADATGGVPYFNRNDLNVALADAISSGNNFYSLAYVPPVSKYDGKFHIIGVSVDRPNVDLHYREGYFAPIPASDPN